MRGLLTVILIVALMHLVAVPAALAQTDRDAQRIAKVKRNINKIGIDEKVQVRLLDGTKLKGRIAGIGDQFFLLTVDKTGDTRRINFDQIKSAGRPVDTPFNDPIGWLAIALIPAIIGLSIAVKDKK